MKLIGTYRLKHPIKTTCDIFDGMDNMIIHIPAVTKFDIYDCGDDIYVAKFVLKHFMLGRLVEVIYRNRMEIIRQDETVRML